MTSEQDQAGGSDKERSEYRLVYNWGQGSTDICEVWSLGNQPPHAYAPPITVGTDDEAASLGEAELAADRLRAKLNEMLAACDKPILRFPEDFA
jgi:hypothetical protein